MLKKAKRTKLRINMAIILALLLKRRLMAAKRQAVATLKTIKKKLIERLP